MTDRTRVRRLNIALVVAGSLAYLVFEFAAPKTGSNTYNLPLWAILVLLISIVGLWLAAVFLGLNSWLRLDQYAHLLKSHSDRVAFGQIASGVRLLAYGLLLTSILGAIKSDFANNPGLVAIFTQVNNYTAVLAPFFGFWLLRQGTRKLAVAAQAAMSVRSKLATIGPPVLLLAAFYVFMVTTNGAADSAGPIGFLVLPINILLVIGSWIFGLLAALNIERATHGGHSGWPQKAFITLYNGILTTTGGIIILDALMSLGTSRIASLPLVAVVILIYTFVAVVGLGFGIISTSGRALVRSAEEGDG